MSRLILGLDIGGTKCAVILGKVKEDGLVELVEKRTFPTETPQGVEHTFRNICVNIEEILSGSKLLSGDIAACGISCGGPLDSKKGIIMSPPNLPGWDRIPIVQRIETRYGIRTGIQNDANACALAEWKYGAARGCDHAIFLTFGTGMGSGLILDGRLYVGTNDMAGEVGHIRLERFGPVGFGKAGSFEGFCSGGGLAQLAQTKVYEELQMGRNVSFCRSMEDLRTVNAKTVAQAAYAGDETALEIYRVCGHYLGHALSILIDILNPEIIVLGSIYARAQQLIEPSMRKVIEQESISYSRNVCRIEPAGLGENIGDYAALSVAAYQL